MPAPPQSRRAGSIIVFDGVCHLCSGWVRFLLRRDRAGRYRFAAMQTPAGRGLLVDNGLDPDDPVSFLLLDDGRVRTDSDAIIAVLASLGGAWRMVNALRLVPVLLRDPVYRLLARHRYRVFGRSSQCWLPDPEDADRFLR